MPKASPAYTAFNAGRWSPLLEGRADVPKYFKALRLMTNFFPKIQGAAVRRPGARFVAEVKDSSKAVRVFDFEFNVEQPYIVEVGDLYFRFYKDNARIEDPPGTPVEIVSPYAEADLPQLKFIQSADVMYIFHPSFLPRKLTRDSDILWTVVAIDPQDGPYLPANLTTTTLTPAATTGTGITVTASSIVGINGGVGFLSTDVGRPLRIEQSAHWGWAKIVGFTSTTIVTVDIVVAFNDTTASNNWRMSVWSEQAGYPSAGTFYEDRLSLGGVPAFPQRLDLSSTGNFENFSPTDETGTVLSSNALSFTLNANKVNGIRWIIDDPHALFIGTTGGEWPLFPGSANLALDATNLPQARRATVHGSADISSLRVGTAMLFIQRAGRKLFELIFEDAELGFKSGDLTELATDIGQSGFKEMAYQQEPDSIVWAAREDGKLVGMTYRREQDVVGWHEHVLGGVSDAAGAATKIESIAAIPAPDGSLDHLWMVVQRYVDGQTKRYIEFLEKCLPDDGLQEDAFYVDSGLTYDGVPVTVLTGLDHLEGETVQILANGASHPDRVVSGGSAPLDVSVTKAAAGLPYDQISVLQTLNIEAGAADGTAQGKTKRITNATFRFFRSLGARVGPDISILDDVPELMFRAPVTPMGAPPPLFTGDAFVLWPEGYETNGRITVVPDGPFPITLLSVYPQVVTQDR